MRSGFVVSNESAFCISENASVFAFASVVCDKMSSVSVPVFTKQITIAFVFSSDFPPLANASSFHRFEPSSMFDPSTTKIFSSSGASGMPWSPKSASETTRSTNCVGSMTPTPSSKLRLWHMPSCVAMGTQCWINFGLLSKKNAPFSYSPEMTSLTFPVFSSRLFHRPCTSLPLNMRAPFFQFRSTAL